MNLQQYLDSVSKSRRTAILEQNDQLTLGQLIKKIQVIADIQAEREDEATVRYDFEYLFPNAADSWRGDYSELALNYNVDGEEMKVSEFLSMLKECVGKSFSGWKGGEYRMTEDTPVWVANPGKSGNTAVIEVVDQGWCVILITGYREY